MRKTLATLVVGAVAAIGISAGAAVLAPTTAVAQEDEAVEETAGTLEDVLGELVGEGVITQEQADVVADRIRERGPLNRFGHHRGGGGHLETVAGLLEIDVADLAEALRDGQSIADLAGAEKTGAVIDALVAEATDRLNQAVADERITQQEADEKVVEITERITDMVNGELPDGFEGRRGFGPRGGGHFGPQPDDAADTSA
ncbi:MAG: hypothetical protein P1T08_12425 [Acidimicrobiia bacterium]|nr:hypothetical protein [Acidimicrobiia bacterium]